MADTELRAEVEAMLVEIFRKALMVEHDHDWEMEDISEAAHICAKAWCDSFRHPALNDGSDPASLIDNDRPISKKVRDHARKLAAELNDGSGGGSDV